MWSCWTSSCTTFLPWPSTGLVPAGSWQSGIGVNDCRYVLSTLSPVNCSSHSLSRIRRALEAYRQEREWFLSRILLSRIPNLGILIRLTTLPQKCLSAIDLGILWKDVNWSLFFESLYLLFVYLSAGSSSKYRQTTTTRIVAMGLAQNRQVSTCIWWCPYFDWLFLFYQRSSTTFIQPPLYPCADLQERRHPGRRAKEAGWRGHQPRISSTSGGSFWGKVLVSWMSFAQPMLIGAPPIHMH